MKKVLLIGLTVLLMASVTGCTSTNNTTPPTTTNPPAITDSGTPKDTGMDSNAPMNGDMMNGMSSYMDGTYRGGYIDPEQVEVEFMLKDKKFEEVKFRMLGYNGQDYLKTEDPKMKAVATQYQELATYLQGKEISALMDLYKPEGITQDIDGMASATLRSSKLISAINDGLGRGPYKLPA